MMLERRNAGCQCVSNDYHQLVWWRCVRAFSGFEMVASCSLS